MTGGRILTIKSAYIILNIADIHFGAMDSSERLYNQLKNVFLEFIDNLPLLHMVVISGDYFDYNLSPFNSQHVKYSLKFMRVLIKRAKKRRFKIRVIKGTRSHDGSQLQNFYDYETDDDLDFKIIEKVEEENIFPNFKVLYIPEEYMKDKKEYYKEYFKKKDYYDMVFGHGIFEEISYIPNNGEVQISHAPIFNSTEIERICKGPVLFGHIHTPTIVGDRIYYTGSFPRFMHGEEGPKGFNLIAYVPENSDYIIKYIENCTADRYVTLNYTYEIEVEDDIKKIIDSIIRYKTSNNIYKLRIQIDDRGNLTDKIAILKEYFSSNKYITLDIDSINKKKTKEQEQRYQMIRSEYGFVFDKSCKDEEKIQKYIKSKTNEEIDVKRIAKFIYGDDDI